MTGERGDVMEDCRADSVKARQDLIDDLPTSTRAAEVRTAVAMADRIAEENRALRQQLEGAVEETERLRQVIRDMKALVPTILTNANGIARLGADTLNADGGR